MKSLIKLLSEKIEMVKAAKVAMRVAEIESRYRITERGGILYITCNGSAICEIADDTNAKKITAFLEKARKTALKFEGFEE